ncbi:beta-ketoacyl synthase chain length factor [Colwellia sp. TT2012]|uniref:beta-ketoacyl synthase chain length factor n=1 Tax=Colwellia sp. TT2012 TaxID=1720342 RepID=UPI0009EB559A
MILRGQLRRLSPFSKIALHCLDMPAALKQNLPLIFASQHGDLAKTITLIKDAALGENLSPTKFSLSVHNATTGLFSIAT